MVETEVPEAGTFAAHDGTRLAFTTVGSGPLLVAHPGGPGLAAGHLDDLGGLSGTRTVLRLDPRGTGRSELPADPESLGAHRLGADLEALREHLGAATLDVLAHSAGCFVACGWAAEFPASVGRLVLVTPSGSLHGVRATDLPEIRARRSGADWYAEATDASEALQGSPSMREIPALVRAQLPFFYAGWGEVEQSHAARWQRQGSPRARGRFAPPADFDLAAVVAALAAVSAPVLVLAASEDAVTGVLAARAVAASFPAGRCEILPGAGHFPWVDGPAFAAAVEAFLAS